MKATTLGLFSLCLSLSLLFVPSGNAATLPLGSVVDVTALESCPSGYAPGMSCQQATVQCPGTADLGVTFGLIEPEGEVKGTVFFHAGAGGTMPFNGGLNYQLTYLSTYRQKGYRVVLMSWATDWEDTGLREKSLQTAACRPATLLNYVYQNIHGGASGAGGMCAQGYSGGSGALGYALALYGASSYLDKVILESGPVFGDIEAGCEVPNAPIVTVCPFGQFGCVGNPWEDNPQYVTGTNIVVGNWTGHPICQDRRTTPAKVNLDWKAMSIVDGKTDATFSYPQTALSGWVCSNGLNNSAAQGEFFYQNFTSAKQTAGYSLTRVDNCRGPEGIEAGNTPAGESAFFAVAQDMLDSVVGCVKRHNLPK